MGVSNIFLSIASLLLREWKSLYEILTKVLPFVSRRNLGVYDIIDYETTLELSTTGKTATFLKRQKVRFLQDHVISFQDYVWGDGEMFVDYKCSPGVVVDRYFVGDRWNILISLRETKSRGDMEEFIIQSTFKNTYLGTVGWQQVEIRHQTKNLKMTVIFPKRRDCRRAIIQQRSRSRTIELDTNQFSIRPDGRQVVTWETKNVAPLEIYTLRWKW